MTKTSFTARRMRFALKAGAFHLLGSLTIAALVGALVLGIWYPYPYREMAGGRELLLLVVGVDVICGPLLTLVLFDPAKRRGELLLDMSIVVVLQLAALGYGLHTVSIARPLFLVGEIDRFKVISANKLTPENLAKTPPALMPGFWQGPRQVVAVSPSDPARQLKLLNEALAGGPDLGERPDLYQPYGGEAVQRLLTRAKPLAPFLVKHPDRAAAAVSIARSAGLSSVALRYLPVTARQDWIALLDNQGRIIGFLQGEDL